MLACASMTRKRRRRPVRKVLGLAAVGAVGTWLIRKKKAAPASPDGTWRDLESSTHAGEPR